MEQREQREKSADEVALQQAAAQSLELEGVARSAAWGMLLAFVSDQTAQRMNHIMLTPIKDMSDASEQNFMRGECAGLNLVKRYLEQEIKVSAEAVELYRQAVSDSAER